MVSAAISKAIVKESMNYGLPMLKLEDIALALWIDFLMKERNLNVRFVDQRKFYKIRTCAESAFTVLLEEGRPLKLGPEGVAKVMHEIVANDKNNRQPACPYESTLEWIQERNEREKAGEVDPQPKQKKQPAPAPVPLTPIPAEAPVPAQKNVRSTSVKVVLYDDPRGYHPELSPGLYECAGLDSCSYRITQDPEDIANANGVVFLGDKEIYGHSGDRVLPTKPQGVPFGYVFREAESKFPAPANKYDFKVTYALDSAAVYPYISDVDRLIAAAQGALSKPKDPDVAPVAFVGLRCGDRPSDPRTERAEIVRRIGTQVGVDSYGVCLNNRTWPDGHVKDKSYVMQTHKFCIAIENSFDFDYVTEKVFDCLAAGSVPIYKGPPNAGRFFPQDAAIWVDEFDSPEDVGRYVAKVAADDKLYEEYRAWIHDPPAEWLAFVRGIQSAKLPCRLCETLA